MYPSLSKEDQHAALLCLIMRVGQLYVAKADVGREILEQKGRPERRPMQELHQESEDQIHRKLVGLFQNNFCGLPHHVKTEFDLTGRYNSLVVDLRLLSAKIERDRKRNVVPIDFAVLDGNG
jgi:hypothetical protein